MNHELKIWPPYFDMVYNGVRRFDIRAEDVRRFSVGDTITYRAYDPGHERYTGRELVRRISCVLRGFPGLADHHAAIGLEPIAPTTNGEVQ